MDVQNLMIIPVDLQPLVFSYLDEYSLGTCLTVCKTFKKTITLNKELKNKLSRFLIKKWGFSFGRAPHKIIQLVGGYKRLGEISVFQKEVNSYITPGLLTRSNDAIDPRDLTGSLLRSNLGCYIICHIKETNVYQNNRPCNRTTYNVMVLFEKKNQLFCHYEGYSDFCSKIEEFNSIKSINEKQFMNIQNLLNHQDVQTNVIGLTSSFEYIRCTFKARLEDPNNLDHLMTPFDF